MPEQSISMFQNAAYAVLSLLVIMTLYTLLNPMFEGDKLRKRMSSVSKTRDELRNTRMKNLGGQKGLRRDGKASVRNLVHNLSLEKVMATSDLRDKLAQAGLRGEKPFYTFYMFRLIMPIAMGFIGLIAFLRAFISK